MVLELYQFPYSPPCRSVLMTGAILGLKFEKKTVDLTKKEHLLPNFLQINPFHCIPTLVDDGYKLWESRAIMTYLVDNYSPGNDLYPQDLKDRAIVDRWLYWDAGTLYPILIAFYKPIFSGLEPSPEVRKSFLSKVEIFEAYLAERKYVCGDKLTLADISIMTSLTTAELFKLSLPDSKNIDRWLKQLESDLSVHWDSLVSEPLVTVSLMLASIKDRVDKEKNGKNALEKTEEEN